MSLFLNQRLHRLWRMLALLPVFAAASLLWAQANPGQAAFGALPSGPLHVEISEWSMPEPNAMPAGVFSNSRDGMVWISTKLANTIERFDPKTEKFETFHLRPGTAPNSLVQHSGSGVQTTMYFTSREGGYLGEFDPNTREVREFRIPGGNVKLSNLTFDDNGVIWFTAEKARGGEVGSLNLFSSEIRLAATPWANAAPQNVVVNSRGTVFFNQSGGPGIGSANPENMKVTAQNLPRDSAGLGGLTITADDLLWFTDSKRGFLASFNPKSGAYAEWPTPGGPKSRPGPIASVDNGLWYVEAATTPLMLVHFYPETHKFQSWPLPGKGDVAHLYAQPDGTLWITRPSTNKLDRVAVSK